MIEKTLLKMSEQSDFYQVVDLCKAKAILGKISNYELSEWRYVCRTYSKAFHTPLDQVLRMSQEDVLLAFFEEMMDSTIKDPEQNIEQVLEMIYELEDPDYHNKKRKNEEEFDKQLEDMEADRALKGLSIQKAMKNLFNLKNTSEKVVKKEEILPTQGGIDPNLFDPDKEG